MRLEPPIDKCPTCGGALRLHEWGTYTDVSEIGPGGVVQFSAGLDDFKQGEEITCENGCDIRGVEVVYE